MTNVDLSTALDLIVKLKAEKKALEEQIDGLQDFVKKEMDSQGKTECIAGSHIATISRYFTTRFDTAAFKEKHRDIYDSFTIEVPTTRFIVR